MPNPLAAVPLASLPDTVPAACRSCGASVTDNYCAKCGEPTHAHVPSAGEFVHEFVGHYVALEGKLWQTLKLLILRPGKLTTEFLAGRRMPYIPPLRLYLTLSLVLFALVRVFSIDLPELIIEDGALGARYVHGAAGDYAPGTRPAAIVAVQMYDEKDDVANGSLTVNERIQRVGAAIGKLNPHWQENLNTFIKQPDKEKADALNHGFLAYVPYMFIGALPLFALYLKLIYFRSGFRYGEHLVFALHSNSLAFLMASLMIVVPGSFGWAVMAFYLSGKGLPAVTAWDFVQFIPLLYLVAYLPVAMQRVYGGSWLATCVRWLVLISAHVFVIGSATLIAELIGIMKHA